jgi:hypothetical protein
MIENIPMEQQPNSDKILIDIPSAQMPQKPMLVAGVVIIEGDKITIQSAPYIEDGWYIEVIHNEITLYEIPQFGGEPIRIDGFNTLIGAIEKANSLT